MTELTSGYNEAATALLEKPYPGGIAEPHRNYDARPRVAGKFLYVGDDKFWVKGVTYGTFRPDGSGNQYPDSRTVERDFALMAAHGLNSVRTYTVPPVWLLDLARQHGLRVMVGLPWEQHIDFLANSRQADDIERRVREMVRSCKCHPAILCYAVGNEVPASIVRWLGRRRVERFLERLYRAVREEDPGSLVTYVNFPTTEYLQLPFVDFVSFNVYLESREKLDAYLARLHNLAGDRPLLMAEIGLDSCRNGEEKQAGVLDWQVRTAFAAGCAGTFVFAWTDEWYRGGHDIEDWDFGLTTRDRRPKPAVETVRRAFKEVPFPSDTLWPKVSVVVCSYNGSRTIRDTLEGLKRLEYPNYEVIVVSDGSTDATPAMASEYNVQLICTENRGLSSARNTGWQVATGEIIAYIDDDAWPDPHWLHYLAWTFMTTDYVGVGGPNIAPAGDGSIADCVANAPGGPVHVLVSDREAEHIPGCNMSFRRSALEAIGGFDPRYRAAGDDVDVCWRLQERGWKIGFHAAAMDWHHRRNSIRMYWKQQQGYGKAEALLEEKWPEKYNAMGHLRWGGRLYGKGLTETLNFRKWRVYHGSWGSALFQSIYQPAPGLFMLLPLMPEWYLLILLLGGLSLLGIAWHPLLMALPLLGLAAGAMLLQSVVSASRASFTSNPATGGERLALYGITALFHLIQPLGRLIGRLKHGLSPWRSRVGSRSGPRSSEQRIWSETWRSPEEWLGAVEGRLREQKAPVAAGGDYDEWDLHVRGGLFGGARTVMAVEEHGAGRQLLRFRIWPVFASSGLGFVALFSILSAWALADNAWFAAGLLGAAAVTLLLRGWSESGAAITAIAEALAQQKGSRVNE